MTSIFAQNNAHALNPDMQDFDPLICFAIHCGGADPDPSGEEIPDYDDYSDGGSSDD